jgi:signal transduction histidine kinase
MSLTPPLKGNKPVHASTARSAQPPELSRHLVRAQEEERKRISRELHDSTGQGLMVLRLYLGMLASENPNSESQLQAQEALRLLDHTIEDLRRIIGRLSPRVLEELGLLAAIRKEVRDLIKNTAIKAQVDLPQQLPLDREIEVALYRALQEALHNIVKHARARSFKVQLQCSEGCVNLGIEDDGIGFSGRRQARSAFGLLGMRERVAALGGTVRIRSRKGEGVSILVTLPARLSPEHRETAARGQSAPAFAGGPSVAHSESHSQLGPQRFAAALR